MHKFLKAVDFNIFNIRDYDFINSNSFIWKNVFIT